MEFGIFVKKMNPFLTNVKGSIAKFLTSKQQTITSYNQLYKILDRYEDFNLSSYNEHQSS
jgi:hypothetical protein